MESVLNGTKYEYSDIISKLFRDSLCLNFLKKIEIKKVSLYIF